MYSVSKQRTFVQTGYGKSVRLPAAKPRRFAYPYLVVDTISPLNDFGTCGRGE